MNTFFVKFALIMLTVLLCICGLTLSLSLLNGDTVEFFSGIAGLIACVFVFANFVPFIIRK